MKSEPVNSFIKRKNIQFKQEKEEKKSVGMKDIGRKGRFYLLREAWTFLPQCNLDQKVFVLERLRHYKFEGKLAFGNWQKGAVEYRIGYFIVGKIGRAKGRWIWGQFCPIIPQKDLMKLINKAKKDKVII
ncbi:MAG: hypothetical protein WC862_03350 [Patescibacteria group bacterium]